MRVVFELDKERVKAVSTLMSKNQSEQLSVLIDGMEECIIDETMKSQMGDDWNNMEMALMMFVFAKAAKELEDGKESQH